MQPIINVVKDKFPDAETLHMVSDGPMAQYKNRFNFYYMITMIPVILPYKVGHGITQKQVMEIA